MHTTMKKGINLQNAEIETILDQTTKHIITAVVKTKTNYYILDLIPFKNYKEFYLFQIDKTNLEKYFATKNRLNLYPREDQEVYQIFLENFNFESHEVLNLCDPMKINLSFYEEDWLKEN
jgi:ATP-dependent RNA circularization protein (DNA/RNA ligase family)